ncbi:MAG: MOSC domain-containing protein [Planctomycetes bacterium]|nr:MOSC domain-containing protein [Planctomycetota bacterium]NOG54171.1 MOSC domain-containing protein [Planctomycetota bacterium]
MPSESIGSIQSLALRTAVRGPMKEVDHAEAVADGGLVGDVPETEPDRGITFLSAPQWHTICSELGADLPWHTRRANVLVESGGGLADWLGRVIQIGNQVRVHIRGETEPCDLMDQLHPGLSEALDSDCRGGVFGRVLEGGPIRVGDVIELAENDA